MSTGILRIIGIYRPGFRSKDLILTGCRQFDTGTVSSCVKVRKNEKIQTKLDYIEFLFSDSSNKMLHYVDNAEVEIAWDNVILNRDGILYMCPEMVLLYKIGITDRLKKSQDEAYHTYEAECKSDFTSALCLMNEAQRKWLKVALISTYPDAKEYVNGLGD